MPSTEHCLRIPNGLQDKTLFLGTDCIYITVTKECCWHYTDKDGCFPASGKGSLPAPGTKKPGKTYGPCTPTKPGKVTFKVVPGKCPPNDIVVADGHTIIVGGGP